jgi:hypothetical protein
MKNIDNDDKYESFIGFDGSALTEITSISRISLEFKDGTWEINNSLHIFKLRTLIMQMIIHFLYPGIDLAFRASQALERLFQERINVEESFF